MANLNDPDVRIQVLIRKDTSQGQFTDAMYFSKAEFDALSNADVRAMAEARKDAWVQAVKDASKAVRVAERKADKQARREQIAADLAALDADIAATPDDEVAVP